MIRTLRYINLICCLLLAMRTYARPTAVSFYICAHQDDWQLFMGASVFNDINAGGERNTNADSVKVVIIYTTSGDLHDSDDKMSCNCFDPHTKRKPRIPYWQVRETGAEHSLHLAACRPGGYGYPMPYPRHTTAVVVGHKISRYEFKNTVSYYLRLKTAQYGAWYTDVRSPVEAIDKSTTYADYSDFVKTIQAIYKTEMGVLPAQNVSFGFPDVNETENINDHHDHLIVGRAAADAATQLSRETGACYKEMLFTDYHIKDLPANLADADKENKAAIVGVYCLALLDYNAWPEWGSLYREWCARSYFKVSNTCDAKSSH